VLVEIAVERGSLMRIFSITQRFCKLAAKRAILWGGVFLGERLSLPIVAGCAVIFLGTALTTGILAPRPARGTAAIGETPARR